MKICPICKKLFDEKQNNKYFQFDSERCQLIDLYSWTHEEYVISDPITNNDKEQEEEFWSN